MISVGETTQNSVGVEQGTNKHQEVWVGPPTSAGGLI